MSLQKYYATNYSKCDIEYSFLASWQGLAYPSHFIQLITFPFQILIFYIVLKKTPKHMKGMKWALFVNHLACASFNFALCTLLTPYVFLPIFGAIGVGLLNWLEIPFRIQLIVGIALGMCAISSFLYLFESHSHMLKENKFRMTRKTTRILYHLVIFLHSGISFFIFFNPPADQEIARLEALQVFPCPTREFFLFPVLVLSKPSSISWTVIFILPWIIVQFGANILFHVLSIIHYLYVAPSTVISPGARKLQKSFLIGISLQTFIPLIFILIPSIALVITNQIGYYSQEVMNMSMICISCHGLAESISVVSVHRSYRTAVRNLLRDLIRTRF